LKKYLLCFFKACPLGWYNYSSSCYKNEKTANYKRAKDTCAKYKYNNIRLGYLTIIESDAEMEFILAILNKENMTTSYVGASNLKNSKF
jgi:hypothetical protein